MQQSKSLRTLHGATMPAKPPPVEADSHTSAWRTFEKNLDSVSHLIALGSRELSVLETESTRFRTYLRKPRDLTKKGTAREILRSASRFASTVQGRVDRLGTATLWQLVVLVTCVEAYFQDLLSSAAGLDPALMSKSQQVAPYADIVAANSLVDLANELRIRWARGWMSDGGPTRWVSRLESMGARGYPKGLVPQLELMWGIRHAIVHSAGVATAEFVRRHPGVVKAKGDRIRVGSKYSLAFFEAVRSLMEPTDRFFIARYPALAELPTEPIK
jgi:hypothetical protein